MPKIEVDISERHIDFINTKCAKDSKTMNDVISLALNILEHSECVEVVRNYNQQDLELKTREK